MEVDQTIIMGAFSALTGAVAFLYKTQASNHRESNKRQEMYHKEAMEAQKESERRLEAKLENCEKRHEEANRELLRLTEQVGVLQGINQLHDDLVKHITNMWEKAEGINQDGSN